MIFHLIDTKESPTFKTLQLPFCTLEWNKPLLRANTNCKILMCNPFVILCGPLSLLIKFVIKIKIYNESTLV